MKKFLPEAYWKLQKNTMTETMLEGFLSGMTCGPHLDREKTWTHLVWDHQYGDFAPESNYGKDFLPMKKFMNTMANTIRKSELKLGIFVPQIFQNADYKIIIEWLDGFLKAMEIYPVQWSKLYQRYPELITLPRAIQGLAAAPLKDIKKIQILMDELSPAIGRIIQFFHPLGMGRINTSSPFFDPRANPLEIELAIHSQSLYKGLLVFAENQDKPLLVSNIPQFAAETANEMPFMLINLLDFLVLLDREHKNYASYEASFFMILDEFLTEISRQNEGKMPLIPSLIQSFEGYLVDLVENGNISVYQAVRIAHMAKKARIPLKQDFLQLRDELSEKQGSLSPKVLNQQEFEESMEQLREMLRVAVLEGGLDEFGLATMLEPVFFSAPALAAQALLEFSLSDESPEELRRALPLCFMFKNRDFNYSLSEALCDTSKYLHPKDFTRLVIMRELFLSGQEGNILDKLIQKEPASKVKEILNRVGTIPKLVHASPADGSGGLMILVEGTEYKPSVFAGLLCKAGHGVRDSIVYQSHRKSEIVAELRGIKQNSNIKPELVSFEFLSLALSHFLQINRQNGTDVPLQWLESIDRLNLPIPTLKALDFPKEMENILALGAYSEKPGDTAKWLDSMGTSASWFSLNPKIREICISHGWDIRASIQKILETVFEEERLDWAEKAAWFALWAAHGKKQSAKLMKETLIAAQFSLDLYSKKPLKDLKGIESLVERSFFAAIHNERLRN